MYLICQDGNLSVDAQMWKMLARKIGNLGKVIDGEKNASMNAKEAPEANNGIPNNRKSQSVQDELQSFFAETSPNDTSAASPKVPIKGTIMSFFKKQNDSAKKAQEGKKSQTPPKEAAFSPFVQSVKKYKKVASPQTLITSSPQQSRVEWACGQCTFVNSQLRAKSGWLKCSICGETHFENKKFSPAVTPTNTQSSQEEPIVLDDDSDDGGAEAESYFSTFKSRRNPKKRTQTKPSSSDRNVVMLDADQDHQDLRNEKVLHNVVNLASDVDPKPESMPFRKKRKVGTQDVICIDDTDNAAKSRVQVKSIGPPSSSRSLLCFSVSKNSGRVTIHFASTNEPSLINFSLEQVLTEETASRLLDTTIHRRSSGTLGIPLHFNIPAIDESKLPIRGFGCDDDIVFSTFLSA